MHSRHEVPPGLSRLAREQAGVVSREQVLAFGLSRNVLDRLLRADSWRHLAVGMYLTAPVEPSWEALSWAGVLIGGNRARLGPESSGYLHRLVAAPPRILDVLVPADRRVRVAGPWRFIREMPGVRSDRSSGAPSRLLPATTALDLANSRRPGEVVGLITQVTQKRLTTPDRILTELAQRRVHQHRALIEGVLEDVQEGVESALEYRYLHEVERPHGLPKGKRQLRRVEFGYRIDVDYELFGLLVELDGLLGHEGLGRFRDMDRDNRHALIGALTLRYGWFDVADRPCGVAWQVYRALVQRGYTGPFRRCRQCTAVPETDLLHL